MKKQKYLLFLIYFLIFIFGNINLIFAAEVSGGPCSGSDLQSCVSGIWTWILGAAGGLIVVSFAIGAVGFIISGDSTEMASSSKDRMKGAILGLFLLGVSVLIMNKINVNIANPTLVTLTTPNLPTAPTIPGVYFYIDASCSGVPALYLTSSIGSLGTSLTHYKIVNDSTNNYGVIIHAVSGLYKGGKCQTPYTTANNCQGVGGMHGAVNIFKINSNPSTSGTGVTFYSKEFGQNKGARGGFYHNDITTGGTTGTTLQPSSMTYLYTNVDATDVYKNKCTYFGINSDCTGSADLEGDYVLAVYSSINGGNYCQVFVDSVADFNSKPVIAAGSAADSIQNIYIYPTGGSSTSTTTTP